MGSSDIAARVLLAMKAVPRTGFLRPADRVRADFDGPVPIGEGQTNSQPRTVVDMLTLLDPRRGDRVLDLGSGSGWTTALLAHLVGPEGSVFGVERIPELVAFGGANLERCRMPWARVLPARPGELGAPAYAPFDRILVSADPGALPTELVDQLRVEGLLVIPVGGRMMRVVRTDTAYEVEHFGWYRFVPLVTGP